MRALLAPPGGLLDRVRWISLLFSLLMAAVVFGLVLRSEVTPLALRLAALSATVVLAWWWIRGYARGGFSSLGIVFEGAAVFAAALATGAPLTALGLFYGSLMFRSLFGPLRNVVALLLVYLAAFYGAAALALSFTYLDLPFTTILPEPLGLPLVAVALHALATTIRTQERTVSREQTLREAGAELAKALDQKEIYGAILSGALRLAQGVPGTRASLAIGPPESMTVVASAGDGAEAVEGRRLDLRHLPDEIRVPVLGKASAWMKDADPQTMREALGFEPKVGSVFYVPLLVDDKVNGVLVVASDGALPEHMRGSLDKLGPHATLALENIAKAEDLYQKKNEERLQALIQNASDLITVVDAEGKIIYESPSVKELFGYEPEEIVGTGMTDMIHPEDAEKVWKIFAQIASKPGVSPRVEVRARHRDGSWRHIEAVANNFLHDPNLRGIVINSRDVTERRQAEEELRHSEERFRNVIEQAADAFFIHDLAGNLVDVNRIACESLGYTRDELVGMSVVDVEENFDLGELERLWETMESGQHVTLEGMHRRKDGSKFPVEIRISLFQTGASRLVLGAARDVTERKRAEEEIRQLNEDLERRVVERTSELEATIADLERAQSALRREEARTRAIVETAPDAIVTMTDDGLVRSFNSGAERIFGYPAGEILGRPLTTLMPERLRETHESELRRHLKTGESKMVGQGPVELAGLRKDGTEFPLELSLGELREEGEILFAGIVRDITERKEAEARARRAEERYRTLVERMPAVTYIQEIGSPDSAMYMSPQIEALTGYTPEDCQNPDLRWRMVHPEDRERLRSEGEPTGEPGDVYTHEYRLLRRDGRTVWMRNESVLVEDEADGSRYWQGFMVDITERKRAEAGLRAYAEKLQRSNRELEDFAHVASHDLQEPLRKISSFSERLRTKYGDALGEQGLDYLRRMEGATIRMQELIEDLLSLSRVTTQANPFEPVDLAAVVPEVLSDLEARLEDTGGAVEVGALPTVEADRPQMRQLLQNLIGNALKFHKDGEPPVVKVYAEPEGRVAANGGRTRCRLVVEDNGIGFDEEHLGRIFVPFERLHGRGTYEGTGMGLAICRKVVERHGGEITAESVPGRGARFITTLTMKQIEEVPAGKVEN